MVIANLTDILTSRATYLGLLKIGTLSSAIAHILGCFAPWPSILILSEHLTIGLFNIKFIFWSKIFYQGCSGFATDYPGSVLCIGLTICRLFISPFFQIGFEWQLISKYYDGNTFCHCFWYSFCIRNCTYPINNYILFFVCLFNGANNALFLPSTIVLSIFIDVVLTLTNHSVIL